MGNEHLFGGAGEGQGYRVMPFYLVCDVSPPMRDELTALRQGIAWLQEEIKFRPLVDDEVMVSIVTFAANARVIVPLGRMSERQVPEFTYENSGAHYGNVFRTLAKAMWDDSDRLRRSGWQVYRPCVYFLTSGDPADLDWERAFEETLATKRAQDRWGLPGYPTFVPFGFRNVQESALRRLAYPPGDSRWYHARDTSIAGALTRLMEVVTYSILTSGQSGSQGIPAHDLPLPGFDSGIASGSG